MIALRPARIRAASVAVRLIQPLRSAMRFLRARRDRAAAERELAKLSDRLLADVGLDGRTVRERRRAADLGSPSRALTPTEIAQGAPAEDRLLALPHFSIACGEAGTMSTAPTGPGGARPRAALRSG